MTRLFFCMKDVSKTNKSKIVILAVILLVVLITIGIFAAVHFTQVPKEMQYKVETVEAKSKDKIKVGILSDVQLPQLEKHLYAWDYTTVANGADHLIKALNYFKTQDVDMVILNGDIVNAVGDYAGYSAYNKVIDYVYGEDRIDTPHFIYPMGNHEFYGASQEHQFFKATNLPLNARTIINGYSFISIANSKVEKKDEELAQSNGTLPDGTYNAQRIAFLKNQLTQAAKEAPEQPIFVFLHMPIDDSIAGGHWATPQFEEIYTILQNYPQAVVFTSHSHYCLSDERSVVQKDFTMVNTGTTSYFDFDWLKQEDIPKDISIKDFLSGNHASLKNKDYLINPELLGIEKSDDVPFRSEVNNGLILDVDVEKNAFTLDKVNFNFGVKFGERFTMNLYNKNSFTRTALLLGKGKMPFFDNQSISVQLDDDRVVLTFGAANQSVPSKYYLYELIDEIGRTTYIRHFAKNYILGYDTDYTEQHVLRGLNEGKYTLRVFAVNSFGLTSETFLSDTFTVS